MPNAISLYGSPFKENYYDPCKPARSNKHWQPWLDPEGELATGFFDFTIDPALVERTKGVSIFVDWQDRPKVTTSVQKLRRKLPEAELIEMPGHGHLVYGDMGTVEFPKLRDVLLDA